MVKQFVVEVEDVDGHVEIFGPFNSYQRAVAWMEKDVDEFMREQDPDDYYVNRYDESRIEVEGYGTWMVIEMTPVNEY